MEEIINKIFKEKYPNGLSTEYTKEEMIGYMMAINDIKEQLTLTVVSGMLKHRSGVKGVFVKSFYPTGKPLTTVIETDKGYYCAPSNEFVDA